MSFSSPLSAWTKGFASTTKGGILSEFFGEFIDLGDEIGERFSAYVECDVIIRNGIRKSRLGVKSKGVYEFTCNRKVCEILV